MNRTELTAAVAEHVGGDVATARRYLDAAIETIARRVADGERVIITGFGTFERTARAARSARNPRTGQPIRVNATNVARFTVGQTFKSMVASSHQVPAVSAAAATAPGKATVKGGKAKRGKPGRDTPPARPAASTAKGKRAKADKATAKVKPASKPANKAAAKAAPKKPGSKKTGKASSAKAK